MFACSTWRSSGLDQVGRARRPARRIAHAASKWRGIWLPRRSILPLGFVLAFAFSAGHQTVLRAGSDAKEFAFTTVDVSGTSTLAQGINDAGDISGIFAAHRRAPSMPEAR